ncbi:MAG TPA: Crp/Fnr family transcriptional regulator [Thermoanaerobaculia bacterium]|nr:Crp/Fnr family transcriptional regulator [Thermoanaerobaculia bacterium]
MPDVAQNRLLAQLSSTQLEHLGPHLRPIEPAYGEVLIEQDQPCHAVFFPLPGAVLSLARQAEDGTVVEVGVIGNEGMAGVAAVLDPHRHLDRGQVQATGTFLGLDASVFSGEIGRDAQLRALFFRYLNAFLMQVAQTALCNRLHALEQRLARWLLMMHERVGRDELRLTQEFLADMLGTRTAGVNESVHALVRAGVIAHARQRMTVVDRAGLERMACECYAVAREEMLRV